MKREITLSDEVDSDLGDGEQHEQDEQDEQDEYECDTENDQEYRNRLIRLRSEWYAAHDRDSSDDYRSFKATLHLPNSIVIQKEDENGSSDSDYVVEEGASGDEEVLEEAAALARARAPQSKAKRKKGAHVANDELNLRSNVVLSAENSALRAALGLAVATLRSHSVTVPDQLANYDLSPVGWASVVTDKPIYSIRVANLVSVGSVPTKFQPNGLHTWPHIYGLYRPDSEIAAIVEARKTQKLTFKMVGGAFNSQNPVYFALELVYDDNDEVVLTSHAEPIRENSVTFKVIFPRVLSSSTTPKHRRFRYNLNCLESDLVIPRVKLPSFYAVSKIKREGA